MPLYESSPRLETLNAILEHATKNKTRSNLPRRARHCKVPAGNSLRSAPRPEVLALTEACDEAPGSRLQIPIYDHRERRGD